VRECSATVPALARTSEVPPTLAARSRSVREDVPRHRGLLGGRATLVDVGPDCMGLGRARLGEDSELDQVTGETEVPGRCQLRDPGEHRPETPREVDPGAGLLRTRRREQVVRLPVVPPP
jgi:hypothetical protein